MQGVASLDQPVLQAGQLGQERQGGRDDQEDPLATVGDDVQPEQVLQDVHPIGVPPDQVVDDPAYQPLAPDDQPQQVVQPPAHLEPVIAGGEILDLRPFLNPEVPEGVPWNPSQENGEGLLAIDRLSPWDCFLSKFGALEEVPRQHQYIWAWGFILEKIDNATTE